ncbi:MAG: alpha/beta hydrolase [Candidatus Micrarchaeota archaeon]
MRAIIAHGSYGSPDENWIPWLKKELEELGWEVFTPKFPTPKGQNLKNWLKAFKPYSQHLEPETILIGHSLAPAFLLTVIEKSKKPILASFLVSGFIGKLGLPTFDPINRTFAEREFNWKKIKRNCKKFVVFYSDNDPVVPATKTFELANNLEAEKVFVKSAGHFNSKAGYLRFPLLLEKIKALSAQVS